MLDVAGLALAADELPRLRDPRVGGVILFARNYAEPAQLTALVAQIRAVRPTPLLVAVDHEGGRVQRFRAGFSALPAPACLGQLHARDPAAAVLAARDVGLVLACELRRCGLDFSFAPVLDLDHGRSSVIGSRALAAQPAVVAELAGSLLDGMAQAGCAGIGKHFPGHGYVTADSHAELPTDERDFATLAAADLLPFTRLAARLGGIMPAHVRYPACAPEPAGFSRFWLREVLRERLGFDGAIFSDDLSMAGAAQAGGPAVRARAAFAAGCDMVMLCNDPQAADALLDGLGDAPVPAGSPRRLAALQARPMAADLPLACVAAKQRLDRLGLEGWSAAP
ncbi:MAG: beta-N-acetylhexosaminidase [Pseudomonadota bacterium]|nr:beta-N-acetylhexosaminidase [Pseudomonadota bacterium]